MTPFNSNRRKLVALLPLHSEKFFNFGRKGIPDTKPKENICKKYNIVHALVEYLSNTNMKNMSGN